MLVSADRVKDTTSTTGTGSVTLSGTAPTGFQTFSSAMATNDTCYYAIVGATGEWEVGLGTLTASTTLARTTVYASSNSNAAVSFSSGTKDVFITIPAKRVAANGTWDRTVTDDLSSYAAWTTTSGTWAVSGGVLGQTNTAGIAETKLTAKVGCAMIMVECEVRLDTASGANRIGIQTGVQAGGGAALAYIVGSGTSWTVSTERNGVVGLTSGTSITYGGATNWGTLRIIVVGNSMTVYWNGAYVITANAAQWSSIMDVVGLYTYQCAASFRNFKVWTPLLPT